MQADYISAGSQHTHVMVSLGLRVASLEEEQRVVAVGDGEGHRNTPQAERNNSGISPQKEANGVVSFAIEGGLMSRIVALEAGMSEKGLIGSPAAAARISETHSALSVSDVAGAMQGMNARLDVVRRFRLNR